MNTDVSTFKWHDWDVVGLIDKGSFGSVYEIRRKMGSITEKAALKVISIPEDPLAIANLFNDGYDNGSITAHFKDEMRDVIKEYECMASLKGYTNIVHNDDIEYIHHDDGIGWDIFIRMERLYPLKRTLENDIPENMVIKLAIEMCSALIGCKAQNIVHRDIKPENIFVSKDGTYKLGDFGIARTMEKTTGATVGIGTYPYMAPEVYNKHPYSSLADIYSLGLVLYWLLNERRGPFLDISKKSIPTADEAKQAMDRRMQGEPLPLPEHGNVELQRIVLKACAYDPKDRYANAEEMREDLLHIPCKPYVIPNEILTRVENEPLGKVSVLEWGKSKLKSDPPVPPSPISGTISGLGKERIEPINDPNSTIGPYRKPPVDNPTPPTPPKESKPSKKNGIIITIIAVCLLACLAVFGTVFGVFDKVFGGAHGSKNWSNWVDTLPASVTRDKYEIESQTLYSSQQKETKTATTDDIGDGWKLVRTIGAGDSGEWSEWSEQPITATATREVEAKERYRYHTKETTTSESTSLSGWTLETSQVAKGDFGPWSEWSDISVTGNENRKVETKIQYKYREKNTTTSTSPTLSGWTLYDTQKSNGAWSVWFDNPISASDNKEVNTRQVETGKRYYIAHYCTGYTGDSDAYKSSNHQYSSKCSYHELGWFDSLDSFEVDGKTVTYHPNGSMYRCANTCYYFFIMDTETTYKTQYQYRDISTTYYYYKYGDWSPFSDNFYSATDNREVKTRTLYRYCDRVDKKVNVFYRWSAWSGWYDDEILPTETKEVEHKTFYHYRDKTSGTTYYFERWSDWSEFSTNVVHPSDVVNVKTKTQYHYRLKAN